MSTTAKVLIGVLGLVVVVMLGIALAAKSTLSGSGKDQIVAALSGKLGVTLKVGSIEASLPHVLSMTPSLSLGGIELGNPSGFSAAPMVTAEEISTRVELGSVFTGSPRIIALEIVKPVVSIEKNAAGKTNLQVFLDGLNKPAGEAPPSAPAKTETSSLAIEDLVISGGSIKVAGQSMGSWGDIALKLNGFGTPRPLKAMASAVSTGAHRARIDFDGAMGPFAGTAMPVDGKLKVGVAAGGKNSLDLDVALKGDLSTVAEGPAKLVVTGYPVGTNEQRMLPLNGNAAGTVTVRQAMSADAAFDVLIPQAVLTLAGGQLNGRIALNSRQRDLAGSLEGALSGLRIEQLIGAFSESSPGVQGGLTMPRLKLSVAGGNTEELIASLAGEGSIAVDKGKLPKMDLLGAITGAIGKTGVVTTDGTTEFAVLKSDFAVARQVLTLSNMQMEGAGLKATGAGTIGMNKVLAIQLNTVVGGKVAEYLGAKPSGDQPARANVPIDIAGTTDNPKVMPNMKGLAGEAAKNYLGGALNKFLGGRKK